MYLQIFTLFAVTGCFVNGQIYTDNCPSLSITVSRCNAVTKYNAPYVGNVPHVGADNVLNLGAFNLTIICSVINIEHFKEVSTCVLNAYRHCGDNDYKKLVLTADAYLSALDYACANIAALDNARVCISDSVTECIRNREAREKKTDESKPDISQPFDQIAEHFCDRRRIAMECAETDEDVLACLNSGTWPIYKEYMTKMKPTGCGAASIVITSSLLVLSMLSTLLKYF